MSKDYKFYNKFYSCGGQNIRSFWGIPPLRRARYENHAKNLWLQDDTKLAGLLAGGWGTRGTWYV